MADRGKARAPGPVAAPLGHSLNSYRRSLPCSSTSRRPVIGGCTRSSSTVIGPLLALNPAKSICSLARASIGPGALARSRGLLRRYRFGPHTLTAKSWSCVRMGCRASRTCRKRCHWDKPTDFPTMLSTSSGQPAFLEQYARAYPSANTETGRPRCLVVYHDLDPGTEMSLGLRP